MSADDLIKIRKEGGGHPKVPSVPSRICSCGGVIFNRGRDEEDELIFDQLCVKCTLKFRRKPEENEELSAKLRAGIEADRQKRNCTVCDKAKPMPNARWCARCCITMHTKDLNFGASSDSIIWAMNYAMKHL